MYPTKAIHKHQSQSMQPISPPNIYTRRCKLKSGVFVSCREDAHGQPAVDGRHSWPPAGRSDNGLQEAGVLERLCRILKAQKIQSSQAGCSGPRADVKNTRVTNLAVPYSHGELQSVLRRGRTNLRSQTDIVGMISYRFADHFARILQ